MKYYKTIIILASCGAMVATVYALSARMRLLPEKTALNRGGAEIMAPEHRGITVTKAAQKRLDEEHLQKSDKNSSSSGTNNNNNNTLTDQVQQHDQVAPPSPDVLARLRTRQRARDVVVTKKRSPLAPKKMEAHNSQNRSNATTSQPPLNTGVMASFEAPPTLADNKPHTKVTSLPETPSWAEIQRGMSSIHQLIQRCYDKSMVPGQVDLTLTVEGRTGHVVKASVSEVSSTAICIRRLARTLRFPPFAKDQIVIKHPYIFR